MQIRVDQQKKVFQSQLQEDMFKQQQQRLQDELLIQHQLRQEDLLRQQQQPQYLQQQQQQHLQQQQQQQQYLQQQQQQLLQQVVQESECYGVEAGQTTPEIRHNVVQAEVKFRVEQQKKLLQYEYDQQRLSEDTTAATLFGVAAASEEEEIRLRRERQRLETEVFLRVEAEKQRLLSLQRSDRIEGHSQRLEQERMRRIQRISAEITRRVEEGRKHLPITSINNLAVLPEDVTLGSTDMATTGISTTITAADGNISSINQFSPSTSSSSCSDVMSLHHLAMQLPEPISYPNPIQPPIPIILVQPKPPNNPAILHDPPTTPSLFNNNNKNPITNPTIVPSLARGGGKKQVDYL